MEILFNSPLIPFVYYNYQIIVKRFVIQLIEHLLVFPKNTSIYTTAHPWCNGHSTSISVCKVWGVNVVAQVSKKEFYTHIHVD